MNKCVDKTRLKLKYESDVPNSKRENEKCTIASSAGPEWVAFR